MFFLVDCTLPETNSSHLEIGWVEDECIFLGWPPGRCELLVSGSVSLILGCPRKLVKG